MEKNKEAREGARGALTFIHCFNKIMCVKVICGGAEHELCRADIGDSQGK